MATKLIVKNFGPIKHVELELTKNMVFIGPQSSGKSTLAKLIAICKDLVVEERDYMGVFVRLLNFYNMQEYIKRYSHIEILKNGHDIKKYGLTRYIIVEEKKKIESDLVLKKYTDKKNNDNEKEVNNEVQKGNTPQGVTYIPSERSILPIISGAVMSLTSSGVPIPRNILFFGGEFERARSIVDGKIPIFEDVTYKYENGVDKLVLDNKTIINLSEASSGYQSAIPMLMVLKDARKKDGHSFIIEEPEQNLYPTSQKEMAYFMAECSSEKNKLFCITTHSPYILTSLNNCLKAYTVGQNKPKEVEKVIKKESWLDPNDFSAYYVGDGGVKSIFNKNVGLIDEEYLDSASDEIMGDFQELLDIR